jgi:hypothetical protein
VILTSGVDDVTREGARRAAREELLDHRYHDAQPPLLVRLVGKAVRKLLELLDRAAGGVPGGRLGLLILALMLAALIAVVVVRLRPVGRRAASAEVFTTGAPLSAAEHRALADELAGTGQWADAVRERLRAIVRELEARGVLEPRPSRTAGEVARDGSAAVPLIADPLRRATTAFDEVWYGGRTADASTYAVLVEADRAVSSASLAVT